MNSPIYTRNALLQGPTRGVPALTLGVGLPRSAGQPCTPFTRVTVQAGFISTIWLYIAGGAAALVAVWFAYNTVDGRGYARGSAAVRLEWVEANRLEEEKEKGARIALD